MQGYGAPMNYPRTAYLLSLIGGILILIGAIVTAALYATGAALFGAIGFGGFAAVLIALAIVALIFGLIVLVLALRLRSRPQDAKMTGILIIVFSLISYIGGGGFYIGGILGLVGGILALMWAPAPMMQQPGWGQPGQPQWGQPQQTAWGQPSAPPVAGKTCTSCGSPNAAGATFCAKCGAALPP